MWQKNKFKLGEYITPMGAAFYIAPLINAITRVGTMNEKETMFYMCEIQKVRKDILKNWQKMFCLHPLIAQNHRKRFLMLRRK